MTDAATPERSETDDDAAPSLATKLLTLQRIDTEADQLRLRRDRLAERDDLSARAAQMTEWERRRGEMKQRLQELTELIEDEERSGAELTEHRARLEAQLKTVFAPREAEALMHEIATIDERRSALDDQELAALEEQAELDDVLSAHLADEEALRTALGRADDALARACADIDAELATLAARRDDALAALDPAVASRYDTVRSSMGVAVAALKGSRCEGCHLDLSAAEVDTAKDEAADSGYTDCPQCGRMLIV